LREILESFEEIWVCFAKQKDEELLGVLKQCWELGLQKCEKRRMKEKKGLNIFLREREKDKLLSFTCKNQPCGHTQNWWLRALGHLSDIWKFQNLHHGPLTRWESGVIMTFLHIWVEKTVFAKVVTMMMTSTYYLGNMEKF